MLAHLRNCSNKNSGTKRKTLQQRETSVKPALQQTECVLFYVRFLVGRCTTDIYAKVSRVQVIQNDSIKTRNLG